MADNLFEELKDVLQDFKDFLDENVGTIQPAVAALRAIIPDQIDGLIDTLAGLMGKLKAEVQKLDVSTIPGLGDVTEFMTRITSFVTASRTLLPDDSSEFDAVTDAANVVAGLPSIEEIKGEIISLIDAITGHVNSLKG